MKITQDKLLSLVEWTEFALEQEFLKDSRSSGNLINTLEISEDVNSASLIIHAPRYNRKKFYESYTALHYKKRPVQKPPVKYYYGKGSYASELDLQGAKYWYTPRGANKPVMKQTSEHKGYAQRAIDKAIETFCQIHQLNYIREEK